MIKYISCGIFKPYIEMLNVDIDITYLDIEGHNYPKRLTRQIQEEIDKCIGYEKIILLYGLCGNALLGIKARDIPISVVRVHDCLSVLLGSKERFYELFKDRLSKGWSCYSLELKPKVSFDDYDEEDREYLESILCPKKDIYISFDMFFDKDYEPRYDEVIQGDLCFLKDIISNDSNELLEMNKNERLKFSEKEIMVKEKENG